MGKKVKQKLVLSRFQVGFGAGSVISRNGYEDPDPYQNETDPQHWYNVYVVLKYMFKEKRGGLKH